MAELVSGKIEPRKFVPIYTVPDVWRDKPEIIYRFLEKQKDYQQLIVVRQMVYDLDFGIEIIGAPTVREPDGLAMSSRNTYLTPKQRISALSLYKSLQKAKELIKSGIKDAATIIDAATEMIQSYPETDIDYIAICDTETLVDIQTINRPVQMLLAVQVGKARLIDNMLLNP